MILSVNNLCKSFGETPILKCVSFHIEDYEKAAIVGINGAGKTTLLRLLMGDLSPDDGAVTFARDKSVGYLSQDESVSGDNTIYNELLSVKQNILDMERRLREIELQMKAASGARLEQLMASYASLTQAYEQAEGYAYKSELVGALKGLGFSEEEFDKKVSTLSGGQKTRVALGKLLLQKPDLIVLDEPTNHLDLNAVSWLEAYLSHYKGAVMVVSHDRFFLDRIADKVIEIDNAACTVFPGNYSAYAKGKEQLRAAALNAYFKQQAEIRHQEAVIEKLRSFNREKSIKRAESREKKLEKIDVLEKPTEVKSDMRLSLSPKRESGNDVLTVENLAKRFGPLSLFEGLSFELKKGEHVAIIGDNGTGKTTILKLINGLLPPDAGEIRLGTNVQIGYYDQEHHVLHPEKTLFDEILDDFPTLTNTRIRNVLAAFLFTGDDAFKTIGSLSGGERGRVSLAKLMLSEANFLILDEPTNHLDIVSREILENALLSYTGTALYVSHDRYFINKTAHRILDLRQRALTNYLGNYDYYLEKKEDAPAASGIFGKAPSGSATGNAGAGGGSSGSEAKQDWKAKKEEQAARRKRENDLKKCEARIEALESRNAEIEALMASPEICTDAVKLQELNQEKEGAEAELATLYETWERLSE